MNRIITLAAGIVLAAGIAACGSSPPPKPAGPPTAASLAARLGCHVEFPDVSQNWAYDTSEYVDANGGACSDGQAANVSVVIITFPSQAEENDWLSKNAQEEAQPLGAGYYELVAGNLWVMAPDSGGATNGDAYIVSVLGGKDTTF